MALCLVFRLSSYKYSSCISKNEEIVHGIPYPDKLFFDGDIVSIDIGVKYNAYADAARTFLIVMYLMKLSFWHR